MFAGHVSAQGLTMTRKVQTTAFPEHETVVVPTGKHEPDGGVHVIAPQLPMLAGLLKMTTLPGFPLHKVSAPVVMSAEQVSEQAVATTFMFAELMLLFGRVSNVLVAALAVLVINVPSGTPEFTLSTIRKTAVLTGSLSPLPRANTGSVAPVHEIVPVPPTAGVLQLNAGPDSC